MDESTGTYVDTPLPTELPIKILISLVLEPPPSRQGRKGCDFPGDAPSPQCGWDLEVFRELRLSNRGWEDRLRVLNLVPPGTCGWAFNLWLNAMWTGVL